ncbi:MAG: substrate-binding domain-containing protein [Oscillospiraceae bacterium]|nr:substrate-binding domain-containing protein [Oscillospiraceae bacterium]
MKKIAKLLALVMALVMALSLAACSKAPAAKDDGTTAPTDAKKLGLEILMEEDEGLINNYTVIAVNDNAKWVDADGNAVKDVKINTAGADAFINWLLSDEGLKACGEYGKDKFGVNLFTIKEDAPKSTKEIQKATDDTKTIRLSTTTSVKDSGLLDTILPTFENAYGYKVEVTSAGTGKAIANAKMGNADVILVHAKSSEEEFVEGGFARVIDGMKAERLTFMYNYFVLVGPAADPAGVKTASDVKDAFAKIANGKYKFVSRGDESGTHKAEIKLWPKDLNITTDAESVKDYTDWYVSANAGMGACIKMADEMGAYLFTDKATYLTAAKNYEEFLKGLDK